MEEEQEEGRKKQSARRDSDHDPARGGVGSFDRFWSAYPDGPRKVDRAGCRKIWDRRSLDDSADAVLAGLLRWKRSAMWAEQAGRFVPLATTFLNQGRWEADPGPLAEGQYGVPAGPDAERERNGIAFGFELTDAEMKEQGMEIVDMTEGRPI